MHAAKPSVTAPKAAFGQTPEVYFAKLATVPGLVGLLMQAGFAAIPWIQWRVR